MSHQECHSDSCGSTHESSSSACSEKCPCGCGCQKNHCGCDCNKKHKYCDELLHLADQAWMELLKEKIKQEIQQKSGDHLTQLAQLISTTNHKRWSEKMQEKQNHEAFEQELKNLMCQKKKG